MLPHVVNSKSSIVNAATAILRLAFVGLVFTAPTVSAQESSPSPRPLPENVEMFTVRTRSEQNRQVAFYLRIPGAYDASNKERVHRLLYICPVYNGDAEAVIQGERGNNGLIDLAEERGWFVLSGTFKQQGGEVRDRKASYYYPEGFSGRAVVEALEQVAKKYPIDPTRILMQGLSGGAQFVHRFAIWAPDRMSVGPSRRGVKNAMILQSRQHGEPPPSIFAESINH